MNGKQIKKRGIETILGEKKAQTVLDSLESTGRATVTGIAEENMIELSHYFKNRGYEVVTMAENMDDENPTYALMVKRRAVQIVEKFEKESEFKKEH